MIQIVSAHNLCCKETDDFFDKPEYASSPLRAMHLSCCRREMHFYAESIRHQNHPQYLKKGCTSCSPSRFHLTVGFTALYSSRLQQGSLLLSFPLTVGFSAKHIIKVYFLIVNILLQRSEKNKPAEPSPCLRLTVI